MRKENVGRLLLSILTAFVMVAGVFGAAVLTSYSETDNIAPVAAREQEMQAREVGEAPISAMEGQLTSWEDIDSGEADMVTAYSPIDVPIPEGDVLPEDRFFREEVEEPTVSMFGEAPMETGTRATGVDADGPYGTEANPFYEGDSVTFSASNIPGGDESDYYYRWDADGDGNWDEDNFGGTKGDTDYTHDFRDNHIGVATVEAWDGVSMKTFTGDGLIWDYSDYGWYMYAGYYATHGLKFTVNQDVTIDQLGVFRGYYPYQFYNLRLWTEGGTLLAQVSNPYVPYYSWRFFNIAPVDLYAGNNYIVSSGIRGYYHMGEDNPGPTADGIIDPTHWMYYSGSPYAFPGGTAGTTVLPLIDVHYTYSYEVPDTHIDTAEVFVDNVAPIAINPTAIGEPGLEGSDIGFTAEFYDIGLDDDWWYRWDYGDGTISDWKKVVKFSGGAKILMATTWRVQNPNIIPPLDAELGDFDLVIDTWDWAPGYDEVPDLEDLMEYHVVVVAENYFAYQNRGPMGDVLADYADAGGNVVAAWVTNYAPGGVLGRWQDDDYNCVAQSGLWFGTQNLGTVYDPGHPIMAGVSTFSCYYTHQAFGAMPGATQLCDLTNGRTLVAYKEAGVNGPGTGRVVDLQAFIAPSYSGGDYMTLFANCIRWASQRPDPEPLPMPISLEPSYHTYVDDHPTHITHQDTFNAVVQVRDDDHLAEVIVGAPTPVYYTDFETGPSWPAGWYEGGDYAWYMRYNPTEMYGQWCARRNYYPYGISHLYSPTFDYTGLGGAIIDFDHWWWTGWGGARQDGLVQISIDGGATWVTLAEYHHNDPTEVIEHVTVMYGAAANEPSVQLRFWIDMYNDWYWEVDNVGMMAADTYTMYGLGEAATTVLIENVFPSIIFPPDLVTLTDENVPIAFEGIEITDPALYEETEEYWYKYIWDDGQETDWIDKGTLAPPKLKVLLVHALQVSGNSGTYINNLNTAILNCPLVETLDHYNWFQEQDSPGVTMMANYDVVISAINYAQFSSWYVPVKTRIGNELADYMDLGVGGVITLMATYDLSIYYGDLFSLTGRYVDDDYGAFEKETYPFGNGMLGDIHDPGHPVMEDVGDLTSNLIHSGDCDTTVGGGGMAAGMDGTRLASWTDNGAAVGVKELTNGMRSVNYGGFAQSVGDYDIFINNAIAWAWNGFIPTPVLDTVEHTYADNGIYNVNIQVIDDDMWWDDSSGEPIFVGTGDPNDWISNNYVPIEIYNVDPVISRVRAYVEIELSLRMSGNKHNTATLTLWENGMEYDSMTVYRDPGAPDVESFPATIEMTPGYYYEVTVEYDPDDLSGANPTWIFDTHWPDGKIKELKHTFNSNDPDDRTWVIPDFKSFMVGHDIIFEADGSDAGSDDLAFVWNWGDTTPFGVNIYAQDGGMVEGVSDEATVIFDQLPNRDPWFDRAPNTIRSPDGGPITVMDEITHVFTENYYFYVNLNLIDDDVRDGYPATELHLNDGTDIECVEIDLR
jgi:hypothetical protein